MKTELPVRGPSLAGGSKRQSVHTIVFRSDPEPGISQEPPEELDATGLWLAPEISTEGGARTDSAESDELVPAIEMNLSDGSRTFAPYLDNVSIATAVDSWSPGTIWLGRKLGKDLVEDDFMILRTHGESDVILGLANKILGHRAAELRASQAHWKSALVLLRATKSLDSIVTELRQAGSLIADYQNLRNWMSPRHIKTQSKDDFVAIMRVIGLEGQGTQLWEKMGIISRAHIRAGMILKNQLTRALRQHSGSELLSKGRLDVAVSEVDSESLTAIRIERIGPQLEVPEAQLLRVFEPWQE